MNGGEANHGNTEEGNRGKEPRNPETDASKFVYGALTSQIIETMIEVHTALGPGFLESIYERAALIALRKRGLSVRSQVLIEVCFEGEVVGQHRVDAIVEERVILEFKACKGFEDIHFATLRSYLKATNLRVGLLINFNTPTLTVKRVAN